MMKWRIGQLVRRMPQLREARGGVIARITKTQVVLTDGTRWRRKDGLLYGMGPTRQHIEDWGDMHKPREAAQ